MSKIAVGIDIGTYQIKVVVSKKNDDSSFLPQIIGLGYAESKGMRHGYIINQNDAIKSIRKAIKQAEKTSNIKIEKAFVSIGGIGLSSHSSVGSVMISRADNEITDLDVEKAQKESLSNIPKNILQNRKIIHPIPIEYKVDGKSILGKDPVGLKGINLEVKMLYVTCLIHHFQEIIQTVENSGIEILDVVASPIAAGIVSLSKTEKIAGCVLANIGSETVSIVVYEDDLPISLEVFPIGSNDITNDIALGLKISLEQAEKIKKEKEISNINSEIPKKKLNDIISARFYDIFELIDAHLKKIGKSGLLPAGIIITGGGSGILNISEIAKSSLKIPSKVFQVNKLNEESNKNSENQNVKIKDSTWSVAYGLCVLGFFNEESGFTKSDSSFRLIKKIFINIKNWLKKFLP
ncbi:MAG TPA: cell division protein FtsA [Candidatus Paceibacterota bacterium]|nr:cell division protein FtsA [Candidatus Paceibacterota bacterium]HMP18843.1 cell division protein FtsA [Candidatus Paceibacterota bacterium]HMP85365.1 cell division protein FtsA [Candidatus Paceibacterota bacterium]